MAGGESVFGRRTLSGAGFRALNAQGASVSQTSGQLGCRHPRPSPLPPFTPPSSSRGAGGAPVGAAPRSGLGRVSGLWHSRAPGIGVAP